MKILKAWEIKRRTSYIDGINSFQKKAENFREYLNIDSFECFGGLGLGETVNEKTVETIHKQGH